MIQQCMPNICGCGCSCCTCAKEQRRQQLQAKLAELQKKMWAIEQELAQLNMYSVPMWPAVPAWPPLKPEPWLNVQQVLHELEKHKGN